MSKIFTFEDFTPEDIEHFGIKGQKWGIRRYQNPDGSLTPLGEQRYGKRSKGRSGKKSKDKSKSKGKMDKALKNSVLNWKNLDPEKKERTLKHAVEFALIAAGGTYIIDKGYGKLTERKRIKVFENMAKNVGPANIPDSFYEHIRSKATKIWKSEYRKGAKK